jgi:hypothetical protein
MQHLIRSESPINGQEFRSELQRGFQGQGGAFFHQPGPDGALHFA